MNRSCRNALLLSGLLAVAPGASAVQAQDSAAAYAVMGPVTRLPNGGRPETKVPFPAIEDWSSLKIKLTRGLCFGTCPAYSVEIDGDGTVRYDGKGWVAIGGKHTGKIPRETVAQLFEEFRKADFFWLSDVYRAGITDNPTYNIAIAFDGASKSVLDYVGTAIGMPTEVRALEAKIDVAAGTEKWVKGNDETLAALKAEGWDFHSASDANLNLLETAAMRNSDLVHELLAAGVPANTPSGCAALNNAVMSRNQAAFDALSAAGAPVEAVVKGPRGDLPCTVLRTAVEMGNLAAVELALDRHADVNLKDEVGRSILFHAVMHWSWSVGSGDYPQIVRRLIAAGADPAAADRDGITALAFAQKFGKYKPAELQAITDLLTNRP